MTFGKIGARNMVKRWTAKSYVQDGLIAMWDGIENAGWGIHDPNATIWKDLTGGDADWALLTNIGTSDAFEVGSDYVKILKNVSYTQYGASSYGGNGHCAPSWSDPSDIKTIEIVIDNSDFDLSSGTVSRIVSFGLASGNIVQTIHVNGPDIATNAYNKYTQVTMVRGLNAYSTIIGSQPVFLNGKKVLSINRTFGAYVYSPPVLGAYAATAAVGMKIKSVRIYGRELTDDERRANWAVDNARFNSGWKNPYTTNGLVAMWDAEWNIGGGKHLPNPKRWVDLSGNGIDMISKGNPVFYKNYISPTQESEMWYTGETTLLDAALQNATLSMEVVGLCVPGYPQPKFCLFGGGSISQSCYAFAACADPTRVGIAAKVGSVTVANYGTHNPLGYFSVTSDGTTVTGRYKSSSGEVSRTASAVAPITDYVSKRFAIGYRYTYYPDSPMTHGERVYCVRVYDRALTNDEIALHYAVDNLRFGIGGAT